MNQPSQAEPESLSVALICHNEARNLPLWLEAIKPVADEIVAVDSGSTDATVEILHTAGARVISRAWSGYADQRNHAAEACTGQWILFLDADERPDEELRQALRALKIGQRPGPAAYELQYKVFFFGRFMRHGGYYPERHLRLYRQGEAFWEKREVHERLLARSKPGLLPGHVEHYSYRDVGEYLERLDRYSAQAARQLYNSGAKAGPLTAWSHAAWAFVSRYFLRRGFLDGYAGYLAARMESLYTLVKYTRLLELNNSRDQ